MVDAAVQMLPDETHDVIAVEDPELDESRVREQTHHEVTQIATHPGGDRE